MKAESKLKKVTEPVSLDSQERLMQVMNDSPSIVKFAGTEWEITALKRGVQCLIAAEACKLDRIENATMGDVLLGIVESEPIVLRILTLALLNDKKLIADKEIYESVYQTLDNESTGHDWVPFLSEIFLLIDVSFFFATTDAIQMLKDMTTMRKTTMKEAELLSQGQSGVK